MIKRFTITYYHIISAFWTSFLVKFNQTIVYRWKSTIHKLKNIAIIFFPCLGNHHLFKRFITYNPLQIINGKCFICNILFHIIILSYILKILSYILLWV